MKKSVFGFFMLAVLLAFPGFAEAGFQKGVKGGVTFSMVGGEGGDVLDPSFQQGAAVGAFLSYRLLGLVGVRSELLYVMKGYKVEDENNEEVSFNVDYLEVPVLFQVFYPPTPVIKPNFFAGPVFGVKLSSKTTDVVEGVKYDDTLNTTDYGLAFGAGIDFALPLTTISLDARYTWGMAAVEKESEESAGDLKNRSIMILAGVAF